MDSEEDAQLLDFEPPKLLDIKREARREWHWFLWLQGKKYFQICEITGWSRDTVWKDIEWVQKQLDQMPSDMLSIRRMALMSLRITRAEILSTIREAKAQKRIGYGNIAKLFDVAANIDKTILQRYTQMGPQASAAATADEERAKAVIDFFVQKYGPESLDTFDEFYTRRLKVQKDLKKMKS